MISYRVDDDCGVDSQLGVHVHHPRFLEWEGALETLILKINRFSQVCVVAYMICVVHISDRHPVDCNFDKQPGCNFAPNI